MGTFGPTGNHFLITSLTTQSYVIPQTMTLLHPVGEVLGFSSLLGSREHLFLCPEKGLCWPMGLLKSSPAISLEWYGVTWLNYITGVSLCGPVKMGRTWEEDENCGRHAATESSSFLGLTFHPPFSYHLPTYCKVSKNIVQFCSC